MLLLLAAAAMLADVTAPPEACAEASVGAALATAVKAMQAKDPAGAKVAIDPVATCPVKSAASYAAHVLRADLAAQEQDWARAHAALAGVGPHPEMSLSNRAGFIRLRADQGVGDAAAFKADRDALIAGNEARLTHSGERLETFRAGAADVTAYRAAVDQGAFHRVLEFVATPDDPGAYPVTVTLTDDTSAAAMVRQLHPNATGDPHAWFLDLYTCQGHSTLAPVASPNGSEPDYATIKTRVTQALGSQRYAAETPAKGPCMAGIWILPGLGRH